MGAGGWILLLGSAVLFGILVRELWRGLAPRVRQAGARRRQEQHRRQREAELAAAPGGSPDRPLEVSSASVVEARATSDPCPVCDRPLYLEEHAVETHGEQSLRAVRVECRFCAHRRTVYVQIAEPMLH